MKTLTISLLVALALPVLVLAAGQLGALSGSAPTDLGVNSGKLKAPSDTRNSVSSQADLHPGHPQQAYARIEPIRYRGDGPAALAALAAALSVTPGVVIVQQKPGYVYAQCSTRWLKFTDDLELWLDESASVIHVRSASRLGREDFGLNRQRVEALRAALAQA